MTTASELMRKIAGLSGVGRGATAGAILGGLHGLIAPGQEKTYDDYGQEIGTKRRNRFGAAVRGALAGGTVGGVGGGVLDHYSPNATKNISDWLRQAATGKNKAQLASDDNTARMKYPQRKLHDFVMQRNKAYLKDPNQPRPEPYKTTPYPVMQFDPEPWESGRVMTDQEVADSENGNINTTL